jgi:hypothetical protein
MNAKARRLAGLVVDLPGFSRARHGRIDGDGEHRVSRPSLLWFRIRARVQTGLGIRESIVNGKFTGNAAGGIFRQFSSS